jgi:hypothetical protein
MISFFLFKANLKMSLNNFNLYYKDLLNEKLYGFSHYQKY